MTFRRKRNKHSEKNKRNNKQSSLAQSVPIPSFPRIYTKGKTLFSREQRRSRVSVLLGPQARADPETKRKDREMQKEKLSDEFRSKDKVNQSHATQLFQYPPSNLSTCLWPIASSHASCNTPPSSPSGNCAPGVNSRQMLWGSSWRSRSGA